MTERTLPPGSVLFASGKKDQEVFLSIDIIFGI